MFGKFILFAINKHQEKTLEKKNSLQNFNKKFNSYFKKDTFIIVKIILFIRLNNTVELQNFFFNDMNFQKFFIRI